MKILIAEDDAFQRKIINKYLEKNGFETILCKDGLEAFEKFKSSKSDICLLDWMMPKMDGIELINNIRKNDITGRTYIILVTAKEDNEDLLKGLNSGADDFIHKPFSEEELITRIKVGKRIVDYQKIIIDKSTHMENLAQERAKQLVHAERMATLGILSAGIAHEINNPSTFISGNIQLIEKYWQYLDSYLSTCVHIREDEKIKKIVEKMPGALGGVNEGIGRISNIVNQLKLFSRQETGKKEHFDIAHIIDRALLICHNKIKYNIEVKKKISKKMPEIFGEPNKIEQVLVNVIVNAADAMENMKMGKIFINAKKINNKIIIAIEDNGPGIKKEDIEKIWQPFFTTKDAGKGTGLGLSISADIIKDHGGNITAKNIEQGGTCFLISLPIVQ